MSDCLRPHGLWATRLLCPWDPLGKNTRMGCHFLLQGTFSTQGLNPHLLHHRWMLYQWPPEKPKSKCFLFFFFNMDTQRKHLLKQGNAKFSFTIFNKWWKESSLTFFDGTKLLWLLEIVVNICILYLEMKPLSQTQARVSYNVMVLSHANTIKTPGI